MLPSDPNRVPPQLEVRLYRKIDRRIVPILFICYILAYLDRVNVGFAKLQMQADLQMTDAVYGIGAGIFFIGYFLFEVPANIIMARIGARVWLGTIMILWGLVSSATMLVHSSGSFYALRLLLGIIEAGFFPGVILYLTFWYPRFRRARVTAAFMAAIPLSGVIGGPVSGWILDRMTTFGGLRGWQWLYLLEGFPSVIAGVISMLVLSDAPQGVKWLKREEKALHAMHLEADAEAARDGSHRLTTLADAFRSPAVWLFCGIYFGFVMGSYGIGFWLPQIISDTLTQNNLAIGFLSVIPWATGAIAMVAIAHHSDKSGERRWHIALSGLVGAAAFAASALPDLPGSVSLAALTIATAGIMGTICIFWSLPTGILSSTAAAAGIAWINSVGNLAGYVSPYLIGKIRDTTHSMTAPLLLLSGSMLASAIAVSLLSTGLVGAKTRAGQSAAGKGALARQTKMWETR